MNVFHPDLLENKRKSNGLFSCLKFKVDEQNSRITEHHQDPTILSHVQQLNELFSAKV